MLQYYRAVARRRGGPLDQARAPLATAVREQSRFHKTQAQAPHGRVPFTFRRMFPRFSKFDVSMMVGVTIPELPWEKTPLIEAEELCAALHGAQLCRFFTTGASGAAKAGARTLYESIRPGEVIAVQASCHISVIDALVEVGAKVVMVSTRVSELGVATTLEPDDLERVLAEYKVGAVIISTPSYEGAVADLPALMTIARQHDVLVMVDQSWGGELDLSPGLPTGAFGLEADLVPDIVVMSPHKNEGAPGQAAWILLSRGSAIDPVVFAAEARKQLSTSSSSPLLVGLDLARREAALNAQPRIARSIRRVKAEKARFERRGLGHLLVDQGDTAQIPYRLVFDVRATGFTGYQLGAMLRRWYGIQVAQSNYAFLCFGFGVGSDRDIRRVFRKLEKLVRRLPKLPPLENVPLPPLGDREVDFAGVAGPESKVEVIRLEDAIGRRAKYPMGGYPPGFCVLVPGAVIREEDVAYLKAIIPLGCVLYGQPGIPRGFVAVIVE